MHNLKIILANRCAGAFWSIEELFSNISNAFPGWIQSTTVSAPQSRANLSAILANLRWAWSLRGGDLIHQTGAIHYILLAIWRCPVILTIHDLRFIDEACGLKRWLYWWWWLYLPCLRANQVTVISDFTRDRLLDICRVNATKVRVIPDCVGPEFSAALKPWPAGTVRVLQVGTTTNKNLDRVLAACAGLPIQLTILGRLSASQEAQLASQGVAYDNHHDLTKQEVVDLYAACDLVMFVSTYEGFGMPILEAQAIGRPVITSNISPMREVAGTGALLVDPFDVAAIRNGLTQLLDNAEFRAQLVRDGFDNVTAYSAEAVAGQYAEMYREVVERVGRC